MTGARLEVLDLSVSLGPREVLRGVRLDVGPGGWLAVIGPNGSGKSTLLRSVLGVLRHSGSVRVDGVAVEALGRRAIAIEADVRSASDLGAGVARIETELGALTVAVNAAGIANAAPAEDMPEEQWRHMLDVNSQGARGGPLAAGIWHRRQRHGRYRAPVSQHRFARC